MPEISENPLFAGLEFLAAGDNKPVANKDEKVVEEVTFTQEQIEASLKTPIEIKEENKELDIIKEIKDTNIKPEEIKLDTENESTEKVDVYSALSELFKEEGLVEKDFKSKDELLSVFSEKVNIEANELLENELNSRPEELQELIKNWKEGVPLDELIKTKSNQMRFSAIDDTKLAEDEDLQKQVFTQYLKETTKYSEDKIKKEIVRLSDVGELADEAKLAKKELIEAEKEYEKNLLAESKKQKLEEEKANKELVIQIHKQIKAVKEIIPGVKISEKENEELFKSITTPVELRGNQSISLAMQVREKDPIKFEMTLNYLIKQGVFEGDWSKIVAKAETKAVNKLEKQLEETVQKTIKQTGASAERQEKDKSKNLMAGLEFAMDNINKNKK